MRPYRPVTRSSADERRDKHSGGEEDLVVVVNDLLAFARWDFGEIEWGDALRFGAIQARDSSALTRALFTWNRRVEPVQHPPTPTSATGPV
jgi:hypothetical protein